LTTTQNGETLSIVDRARGIDVSHYNADVQPVDFGAVFDNGISFVGIKATQGNTFTDPKLAAHRAGVRSQPFAFAFFYHFCAPGDPVAQADRFVDTVGELRGNERLCVDLEDDRTGRPAVDLIWTSKFYGRLLGGVCSDRKPLIYTSRRVWLQLGNPTWDLASEIDLMAPRYGPDEPELPLPWKLIKKPWSFWQNSEDALVPGVNGKCDSSFFNGDVAALQAYAALGGAAPAAPLVT
jgi:lysozyme